MFVSIGKIITAEKQQQTFYVTHRTTDIKNNSFNDSRVFLRRKILVEYVSSFWGMGKQIWFEQCYEIESVVLVSAVSFRSFSLMNSIVINSHTKFKMSFQALLSHQTKPSEFLTFVQSSHEFCVFEEFSFCDLCVVCVCVTSYRFTEWQMMWVAWNHFATSEKKARTNTQIYTHTTGRLFSRF